jgi:hypothetical protein
MVIIVVQLLGALYVLQPSLDHLALSIGVVLAGSVIMRKLDRTKQS